MDHPGDTGFIKGTDNTLTCSIKTESDIVPSIRWFMGFSVVGAEKVYFHFLMSKILFQL